MSDQNPEHFYQDGDPTNKMLISIHPDDMPPGMAVYEDLSRDVRDIVAELNADMYWYDITQASTDPKVQGLLARTDRSLRPETRISRSEKAAFILRQLRLF